MIGAWFRAFLFTQILEMGVHASAPSMERPRYERFAIAFGASAITHPAVWFIIPQLAMPLIDSGDHRTDWWIMVAIAETFAVVTEALWLRAFGVPSLRAGLTSLTANAFSFGMGLFCYYLLDW